jgi:hypothetical protein
MIQNAKTTITAITIQPVVDMLLLLAGMCARGL